MTQRPQPAPIDSDGDVRRRDNGDVMMTSRRVSGRTDAAQSAATAPSETTTAHYSMSTDVSNTTAAFLSSMQQRRQRVDAACSETGSTIGPRDRTGSDVIAVRDAPSSSSSSYAFVSFARAVHIDVQRGVLYCAVPKVASSTLKLSMALQTGNADDDQTRRALDVHNPAHMARLGVTSLMQRLLATRRRQGGGSPAAVSKQIVGEARSKFVVVRDPLERVVSAFRDKFEHVNRWNEHFHNKFGKQIVKRPPKSERDRRWLQRFDDMYGRLIVSRYRDGISRGDHHNVSFAEFVRFITDEKIAASRRHNPHWSPVSELCRPCQVRYDFVVRLERFDVEAPQLWRAVYGRSAAAAVEMPSTIHRHRLVVPTSPNVTAAYLRQLTPPLRRRLERLYADDFRLFGYSTNVYGAV